MQVMDQNGRPRQAAPGIRSTVSFIIFLESLLGQGATSRVYLGRHKKSGKRVACKVPHLPNLLRGGIDMERESRVLLKLKHPNIVCLEEIEKDQISRENILFMELCTAGSLFDMLEKPEHSHGVQERVFLQVLNDITCGMKYLRDNGLVHRDVKPGNIMCFTDESGRTIYKLADFGAARELTDDENFTSLHGTEEYLHPNIFERAVLRRPTNRPFDARVDLWSIGATLYHIATGSLPFRPQGGRKNSSMMFYLTTKKASGVISGVQTGPGEHEVKWSRELPETCLLSTGLKNLVTPMLSGLLEYSPTKVWSFNQFFEVSQSIASKKPLHVFWVCQSSNIKIYSDPTDTFADFQELIAAQTRLSASKQMFTLDGETFGPDGSVMEYPYTSETNPIMLCNREQVHVPCQIFPPLVAFMPALHPRFSTQNDYPIAKSAVTVGHILQRRQEEVHHMHTHFDRFVKTVDSGLSSDLLKLQAHNNSVKGTIITITRDIQTARRILDLWHKCSPSASARGQTILQQHGDFSNMVHQLSCKLDFHSDLLHQCEMEYDVVSCILERLHGDLNRNNRLNTAWKPSEGCNMQEYACTVELVHLTHQTEDIFKRFAKDKKTGKLSYNDEQIHKMEKLTLGEKMKLTTKCIGRCEERWRQRHSAFLTWYNKSHNHRVQISEADSLLTSLIQKCAGLGDTVTDLSSKCWQVIESRPVVGVSGDSTPIQSAKAMAHILLLESSTQTSLPPSKVYHPLTNGMDHHTQLTKGGNPLMMGPGAMTATPLPHFEPSGPKSPRMYSGSRSPGAVSAPSCGASYYFSPSGQRTTPYNVLMNSSPAVLVAHGPKMPASPQDSPSELRGHMQGLSAGDMTGLQGATAPAGDSHDVGRGARMVKVTRRMKQDIENYKKQSSSIPELLQASSDMVSQLADLSLDYQMPDLQDDSIFLPTLTPGPRGSHHDDDDDDIGSLDIKRPPTSYRSVDES